MTDEPHVLRPFDRSEAVSVSIAARLAGVSPRTVQNWCAAHSIGRRIAGGPWRVSRVALQMLVDGDAAALRAYLDGDRTSERVAEYFRRAGLKTAKTPQNQQSRHGGEGESAA